MSTASTCCAMLTPGLLQARQFLVCPACSPGEHMHLLSISDAALLGALELVMFLQGFC